MLDSHELIFRKYEDTDLDRVINVLKSRYNIATNRKASKVITYFSMNDTIMIRDFMKFCKYIKEKMDD